MGCPLGRLYTAGAHQARLDPFLPEQAEDVAFIQTLLDGLHARFKDWVRARRAGRLAGEEAGLIDGMADVDGLVRTLGGAKARPRVSRIRPPCLLRRLPRLAVEAAPDAAEERGGRPSLLP